MRRRRTLEINWRTGLSFRHADDSHPDRRPDGSLSSGRPRPTRPAAGRRQVRGHGVLVRRRTGSHHPGRRSADALHPLQGQLRPSARPQARPEPDRRLVQRLDHRPSARPLERAQAPARRGGRRHAPGHRDHWRQRRGLHRRPRRRGLRDPRRGVLPSVPGCSDQPSLG